MMEVNGSRGDTDESGKAGAIGWGQQLLHRANEGTWLAAFHVFASLIPCTLFERTVLGLGYRTPSITRARSPCYTHLRSLGIWPSSSSSLLVVVVIFFLSLMHVSSPSPRFHTPHFSSAWSIWLGPGTSRTRSRWMMATGEESASASRVFVSLLVQVCTLSTGIIGPST